MKIGLPINCHATHGPQPMPLMVPILSILCPKQPLFAVFVVFLVPGLCFRALGWSLMVRMPLARVSGRRSRSSRILARMFSNLRSLSPDARKSDSSSPSKDRRDCKKIHSKQCSLITSLNYKRTISLFWQWNGPTFMVNKRINRMHWIYINIFDIRKQTKLVSATLFWQWRVLLELTRNIYFNTSKLLTFDYQTYTLVMKGNNRTHTYHEEIPSHEVQ